MIAPMSRRIVLIVRQLQKAESFAQCYAFDIILRNDSQLGVRSTPLRDTYNPHPMYYSAFFLAFLDHRSKNSSPGKNM
tara:strand:- start:468 stop:701 length:234 start_codon:yes stop_codon:yes gene_type:complete